VVLSAQVDLMNTHILTPTVVTDQRDLDLTDPELSGYVWIDPARMHGEACFLGTRIPVKILFDHLRNGDSMEEFLEGFPDVAREQAIGLFDLLSSRFLNSIRNQ
jgi:uncharacterized protein (DUF433 family)